MGLIQAKSYEVRTAVFADAAARQKTADAIVASLQTVHHLYTRFIETEDVATAVKLNGLPVHVPDLVAYFEKHPEPYQPASNAWRSSPSAAGNVNSNGNGNNNGNGTANPSPAKRGKTDGNEPWIVRKIEMLLQSTKPLWHNISQAPLKEGHKCQICNVRIISYLTAASYVRMSNSVLVRCMGMLCYQSNMHYATDVITDPSGEFVYLCPKMAPHKVVSAGRDVNTK